MNTLKAAKERLQGSLLGRMRESGRHRRADVGRARRQRPEVLGLEPRLLLVHDLGLFLLNGEAVNPTPGAAPHDWSDVYHDYQNPGDNYSGTGGAFTFIQDPTNSKMDNIFTGGQTKDTNGLGHWQWTLGTPQDKTDIANAYAAAYTYTGAPTGNVHTGDTIMYLGLDRYDSGGTSTAGFWLFQNPVSLNPDGTFSGVHTNGDVLLVSDYTSSGSTINAYRWTGNDATGTLTPVTLPSDTAYAISNATSTTSPWPYNAEVGPVGLVSTPDVP